MMEDNKKIKTIRVSIGVPTFSGLEPEFFDSFMAAWSTLMNFHIGSVTHILTSVDNLERVHEEKRVEVATPQINAEFKVFLHTVPRTQNHHARNLLIEHALEFDSDYLIMVDDDMVLQPQTFVHMLTRMERLREVDVLAMLAFKRGEPYTPVGYYWQGNNMLAMDYNPDKKGLVDVDAVGFGCVIIRCSLLEKMNAPWCLVDDIYRGSDIYFCHRAKTEFGSKIFIDTEHEIGHLSFGKPIGGDDYLKYYGKK